MYDFDFISTVYGICCGVVPTVIIMTFAVFYDDSRRKDKE